MVLSLLHARHAYSPSLSTSAKTSLQSASVEILDLLKELRKKVAIGFVGGSDLVKITEQLSVRGNNSKCELPGPQFRHMRMTPTAQREFQSPMISTSHLPRMV